MREVHSRYFVKISVILLIFWSIDFRLTKSYQYRLISNISMIYPIFFSLIKTSLTKALMKKLHSFNLVNEDFCLFQKNKENK